MNQFSKPFYMWLFTICYYIFSLFLTLCYYILVIILVICPMLLYFQPLYLSKTLCSSISSPYACY